MSNLSVKAQATYESKNDEGTDEQVEPYVIEIVDGNNEKNPEAEAAKSYGMVSEAQATYESKRDEGTDEQVEPYVEKNPEAEAAKSYGMVSEVRIDGPGNESDSKAEYYDETEEVVKGGPPYVFRIKEIKESDGWQEISTEDTDGSDGWNNWVKIGILLLLMIIIWRFICYGIHYDDQKQTIDDKNLLNKDIDVKVNLSNDSVEIDVKVSNGSDEIEVKVSNDSDVHQKAQNIDSESGKITVPYLDAAGNPQDKVNDEFTEIKEKDQSTEIKGADQPTDITEKDQSIEIEEKLSEKTEDTEEEMTKDQMIELGMVGKFRGVFQLGYFQNIIIVDFDKQNFTIFDNFTSATHDMMVKKNENEVTFGSISFYLKVEVENIDKENKITGNIIDYTSEEVLGSFIIYSEIKIFLNSHDGQKMIEEIVSHEISAGFWGLLFPCPCDSKKRFDYQFEKEMQVRPTVAENFKEKEVKKAIRESDEYKKRRYTRITTRCSNSYFFWIYFCFGCLFIFLGVSDIYAHMHKGKISKGRIGTIIIVAIVVIVLLCFCYAIALNNETELGNTKIGTTTATGGTTSTTNNQAYVPTGDEYGTFIYETTRNQSDKITVPDLPVGANGKLIETTEYKEETKKYSKISVPTLDSSGSIIETTGYKEKTKVYSKISVPTLDSSESIIHETAEYEEETKKYKSDEISVPYIES